MDYSYLDCLAVLGIGGAHPGGLRLTKNMLSKENVDKTKSVLDVGCGTGQTAAYIAGQYGCQVTALDNNPIMLDKARQRFSTIDLPIDVKHGNMENLPFEDNLFDMVLSESVLSFTEASLSIPESKRVLRANGALLAVEMILEGSFSNEELTDIKDFYGVSQLLSENEWITAFRKGGFNQIRVEKQELNIDEYDIDDAADFSLSENIDPEYFDILEKHEHVSNIYKERLGFRIFRCSV